MILAGKVEKASPRVRWQQGDKGLDTTSDIHRAVMLEKLPTRSFP